MDAISFPWDFREAEKVLRLRRRGMPRRLCYAAMSKGTLSVFVDESGRFQYPDDESPYYIVSLVLHDQADRLDAAAAELEQAFRRLNLSNVCFHAGPLIRQKGPFAFMDWSFRRKIFNSMMAFARNVDYRYHCLVLDKRYVNTREQMLARLSAALSNFLDSVADRFGAFDLVKIYYDCGQTPVTNLLHDNFKDRAGQRVEFAQAVLPEKYRLFQLADMICSVRLVRQKLENGERMTESEYKFFGGPRKFRREVLKPILRREI